MAARATWPEGLATLVSALAGMIAITAVAMAGDVHFRFPLPGLRPLARVPGNVLRDTLLILGAAFRRPGPSKIVAVPFEPGDEGPRSSLRRALVVGGICLAPNTVVTEVDSEGRQLLVHEMLPTPPPAHREWPL